MRMFRRTFPGLSLLFVGALAPVTAARAQAAKDVNVVNTPSVNVANTPSVSVTNTPNVNVVNNPPQPAPFQQRVFVSNPGEFSETCVDLVATPGKTLLLESLSFEAQVAAGDVVHQSDVYVRFTHHFGGGGAVFTRLGTGAFTTFDTRARGIYMFRLLALPNLGGEYDTLAVCATGGADVAAFATGQLLD